MDDNSVVKYIIGASRIKYAILDDLFSKIDTKNYDMGVMYVDAHSILYRLYREKEMSRLYSDSIGDLVRDIVVGFFNVIGHYRRYMATRLHLDNDIFVLFNRTVPKYHASKYPKFRQKLYQRYDTRNIDFGFTSQAINKAYQFIQGISPYFEGIYCIDCNGVDECALTTKLGFGDENFNIIFSRNLYFSQLIRKNVVQLYSSRDNSRLLTSKNCYKEGVLHKSKTEASPLLTPDMLPLIWTLGGCSDIEMEKSRYSSGVATTVRIANQMAEAGDLIPGTSFEGFYTALKNHPKVFKFKDELDRAYLEDRYSILNANIAGKAITLDQYAGVIAQCYDIFDETGLENLNELLVASGGIDPQILEIENLNMSIAPIYGDIGEEYWDGNL